MKEVYTIALVRWKNERSDSHCNSIYSSLEKAKRCVEKDGRMLSDDGYFQYIVIEKVMLDRPYNLHHSEPRMEPIWYKYDEVSENFKEVLTPDFAKCIIGWSVG